MTKFSTLLKCLLIIGGIGNILSMSNATDTTENTIISMESVSNNEQNMATISSNQPPVLTPPPTPGYQKNFPQPVYDLGTHYSSKMPHYGATSQNSTTSEPVQWNQRLQPSHNKHNVAKGAGIACVTIASVACVIGPIITPPILASYSNTTIEIALASAIIDLITGNIPACIPAFMYWYGWHHDGMQDEMLQHWNIGLTIAGTCFYLCCGGCYTSALSCFKK